MPWKDAAELQSNTVWEHKLTWFKSSSQYRTLDTTDGEPMELEWNIFPGFTTLQLVREVQEFLSKMSMNNERPQGEWHRVAELMMIKFRESGHPVFRATNPLSRGTLKSKGVENYQYTFALTRERLKLIFAWLLLSISSVFTEQSQICVKKTNPAM